MEPISIVFRKVYKWTLLFCQNTDELNGIHFEYELMTIHDCKIAPIEIVTVFSTSIHP